MTSFYIRHLLKRLKRYDKLILSLDSADWLDYIDEYRLRYYIYERAKLKERIYGSNRLID